MGSSESDGKRATGRYRFCCEFLAALYTTFLKSINPRSTSVLTSCTRSLSPTRMFSKPLANLPSTGGCRRRTHVPLSDAPVTMASNCSPILDSSSIAAADFVTCRSTFFGAVFCERFQFIVLVWHGTSRHCCLQQSLCNHIGVSAVRGGGVSVILDRKTEVPGDTASRKFDD